MACDQAVCAAPNPRDRALVNRLLFFNVAPTSMLPSRLLFAAFHLMDIRTNDRGAKQSREITGPMVAHAIPLSDIGVGGATGSSGH